MIEFALRTPYKYDERVYKYDERVCVFLVNPITGGRLDNEAVYSRHTCLKFMGFVI